MIDNERLKHTDRRILSPIDVPLWDRAQWRANLFVCSPDAPPILGMGFEDGEAGQAIFRMWKAQWGYENKDEVLRVAIITRLSERNPAEYAVVIGPNLRQMVRKENKVTMSVSRVLRASPNTSTNLDNFVTAYKMAKFIFPCTSWAKHNKWNTRNAVCSILYRQTSTRHP